MISFALKLLTNWNSSKWAFITNTESRTQRWIIDRQKRWILTSSNDELCGVHYHNLWSLKFCGDVSQLDGLFDTNYRKKCFSLKETKVWDRWVTVHIGKIMPHIAYVAKLFQNSLPPNCTLESPFLTPGSNRKKITKRGLKCFSFTTRKCFFDAVWFFRAAIVGEFIGWNILPQIIVRADS